MFKGIMLCLHWSNTLGNILYQIVNELFGVYPSQQVEVSFDLNASVICDENRIPRMVSNLLNNAEIFTLP